MKSARSTVIRMRLPAESGNRLKRMASRHGWTASDASARLVEEGLRRSEFAFVDFRDSAGRQAYIQGVIFVDERTISPADTGGLVRALSELARTTTRWDWSDRVCFLRR